MYMVTAMYQAFQLRFGPQEPLRMTFQLVDEADLE